MLMRVFLIVACLTVSTVAFSGEQEERAKTQQAVAAMFADNNFAALEALAESYRSEKTRTPSGAWQLTEYYNGLTEVGLNFPEGDQESWTRAAASIDSWINAYPNSPTPYIVKGAAIMNDRWAYRGEGWAGEVEDASIGDTDEHAMFATTFLMDNIKVGSNDPHWYYLIGDALTSIVMPKDEYLEFVGEGLDRYPDYDPLYFKLAGYLSPNRFGSLEELETFAQDAVKRTQASRGYELYARIYWATGFYRPGQYAFQSPIASWSKMVKGMEEVVERYPDQWNINNFAYFSCINRDLVATIGFLQKVKEPVPATAWGDDEMNYQACRLMVNLRPSPNMPMPDNQRIY
jgi:hypothetical protein